MSFPLNLSWFIRNPIGFTRRHQMMVKNSTCARVHMSWNQVDCVQVRYKYSRAMFGANYVRITRFWKKHIIFLFPSIPVIALLHVHYCNHHTSAERAPPYKSTSPSLTLSLAVCISSWWYENKKNKSNILNMQFTPRRLFRCLRFEFACILNACSFPVTVSLYMSICY